MGRAAGAANELRGRCLIAGLLRTAARGLTRPLYPLTWCSGSGPRRRQQEFLFANCGGRRRRCSLRMDLGLVGRAAGAANELRGRCLIAGLLRTAARGLTRPLYPLTWCSGSGPRRRQQDFFRELRWAAAMQLEDGPRAGGASGRGGDELRGRCLIAGLLRTAARGLTRPLYPLTWCSGSGPRRRQQDFFRELRRRRCSLRMDLGLVGRAAVAATSYGVDA